MSDLSGPLSILLIGAPGEGKSRLIDQISKTTSWESHTAASGATQHIQSVVVQGPCGDFSAPTVTLYDSPGLMDPKIKMSTVAQELDIKLGGKKLSAVWIVSSAGNPRLANGTICAASMVSELSNIAPEQVFMLITKGHQHNAALTKKTLKEFACQRIEELNKSKKLRVKLPPNNFILADTKRQSKPVSDTNFNAGPEFNKIILDHLKALNCNPLVQDARTGFESELTNKTRKMMEDMVHQDKGCGYFADEQYQRDFMFDAVKQSKTFGIVVGGFEDEDDEDEDWEDEEEEEEIPDCLNVREVRVRTGDLVDMIMFIYADSSYSTYGTSAGGNFGPVFRLAPDEHIVRIDTRSGNSLDAIRFHTSHERVSNWYGGRGGDVIKRFEGTDENPIVGIVRERFGFCPKIRDVVYWKYSEAIFNGDGFQMRPGVGAYVNTWYCARILGTAQIPGSDGQCGPHNGPQCASCRIRQRMMH